MNTIKKFFLVGATISALSWSVYADSTALTPEQEASVQGVVKSYLLKNPEIIIEAVQNYQKQQQQAQISQAVSKIKENTTALFDNPYSPVIGNPKGNIALVEFFDFRCPHCKDASANVLKLKQDNKDLRVIYKNFPIFGGPSMTAAKASIASFKLDPKKYAAFHRSLMTFKGNLSDDDIFTLATKAGYDAKDLKAEMEKSWVKNQVKANMEVGTTIGVNATPMFVLANLSNSHYAFIPGAVPKSELEKQIAELQ